MKSQMQKVETLMLVRVIAIAIAALLAPVMAGAQTETVYYFHTDAIGSVRMVTDASGQEVARHDYLPFGEEWASTSYSNIDNRMKYAGLERDPEIDLDYAMARYYRPQSGRFTQADDPAFADPLHPQSAQLYGYAYNNPLTFVDPTGHEGQCIDTRPIDCRDPWAEAVKWAWELEEFSRRLAQQLATTAADAVAQANQSLFTSLTDCRTGSSAGVRCKALLDAGIEGSAMLAGGIGGIARGAGLRTLFKTTHYASRIKATGVSVSRAQSFVRNEIAAMRPNMAVGADVWGRIRVDGVLFEYRARLLQNGTVNVGTIFPVK